MKRICAHLVGRIGLSRFLQWRPNAMLMRYLPLRIGRAYIGLLGRAYFFINRSERDEIKRNLTAVVGRMPGRDSIDLITRRTFYGFFAHYHEKLLTAYANYHKVCHFIESRMVLEGQQLLDQALAQGRGAILVPAHFGAVEFLPTYLALNGYRVTMVVRFKTERLKRALSQRAARLGITLLDATEGEGVIFSACQSLKSNQILITECDEFLSWRPDRHRQTSFLGCYCPLDRTLDILQRRYDSPVIMGLVRRLRNYHYGLELHSLNALNESKHVFANESIAQRALETLQWYICLAPEQWYQWKQVHLVLGTKLFEAKGPVYATEADRILPVADSPMHAN
jgi:KDO2-lipid IV(A) lauroyltransferase